MKLAVLDCMNPMNSVFSEEGKKECVACYAFVWLYLPALPLINEHVILSALNPVNILYIVQIILLDWSNLCRIHEMSCLSVFFFFPWLHSGLHTVLRAGVSGRLSYGLIGVPL